MVFIFQFVNVVYYLSFNDIFQRANVFNFELSPFIISFLCSIISKKFCLIQGHKDFLPYLILEILYF